MLLPAWPIFSMFMLASVVLAVSPGPGVVYIVTRSLLQGRAIGLVAMAGIAFGNLGNALAAALGLAALFALSAVVFSVIKYAGALYLIYLGVRMLRSPDTSMPVRQARESRPGRVFRDGFVVAFLNPKTTLFFAAFLPQFTSSNTSLHTLQMIVLGSLFVAIAAVTDSIYALAAGTLAPLLARKRMARRFGKILSGSAFIGLGIFSAVTGPRR